MLTNLSAELHSDKKLVEYIKQVASLIGVIYYTCKDFYYKCRLLTLELLRF